MSKAIQLHYKSLPVAVGNLESYVQMAHEFPVLSRQEEYRLARRLRPGDSVSLAVSPDQVHARAITPRRLTTGN